MPLDHYSEKKTGKQIVARKCFHDENGFYNGSSLSRNTNNMQRHVTILQLKLLLPKCQFCFFFFTNVFPRVYSGINRGCIIVGSGNESVPDVTGIRVAS